MKRQRMAATAIGVTLAGVLAATAFAANTAGQLDPSFGGTGYVTTDVGVTSFAAVVAVAGDKTIAVGAAATGSSQDFAVVRYNKNASLDTTFGIGGRVTTDFAGYQDVAQAVAVTGEKIVVAGYVQVPSGDIDFGLARYNRNGSLDSSFGTGGKVVTGFGDGTDFAFALAVKGDRIVAGGNAGGDFALAQYTKTAPSTNPSAWEERSRPTSTAGATRSTASPSAATRSSPRVTPITST